MDLNKCQRQAEKLADKAIRSDNLTIDGNTYTLEFKATEWVYTVKDSEGNFVVNFNTKKVTEAKKWLKEYLTN